VIGCCNTVRSFKQFKNNFIDQGDDMCIRASVSRINFIKDLISANSPPRKNCSHLLTLWQRALLVLVKDSPILSHRKVQWVWSPESATGKSSITDLIRNDGSKIFVWPQLAEIKDALGMYNDEPVVIFDIPRDGRVDWLYPILETVSDQTLIASGKYQGVIKRFVSHTIVLSNFAPEHSRLPGRIEEIRVKPLADETYEQIDIATQLSF
jgi:hypothetical protein